MDFYLFLDMDGVLNHEPHTIDCGDSLHNYNNGWAIICSKCVDRLNQLVKELNACRWYKDVHIILSSTWRKLCSLEKFNDLMHCAGFSFKVTGRTNIDTKGRDLQILDFLESNFADGDEYIVIDDDWLDLKKVKARHVLTYNRTGFDNDAYNRAIQMIFGDKLK